MTSPNTEQLERARLLLGHAAVQRVADLTSADVLHIKGYALDAALRWEGRASTDVDVLVRPGHVGRLLDALYAAGWTHYTGFDAGSPFGHAATIHHEVWGYADIHRAYPGISHAPHAAFARLWEDRQLAPLGGFPCAVPSTTAQRLVLLLHAAKLTSGPRARRDVETTWTQAPTSERDAVRALAADLGAEVALAAAIGELERYRDRPEYALWRVVSEGGTRIDEWRARVSAAPTLAAKMRIILRAPLVNVEHLAAIRGHQPSRAEVVREFFARPLRGVREEWLAHFSRGREPR